MDEKLFDIPARWQEEWIGMPEYNNSEIKPFKTIQVKFESEEDMISFSKLINQTITIKTKGVWFPKKERDNFSVRRYVDES